MCTARSSARWRTPSICRSSTRSRSAPAYGAAARYEALPVEYARTAAELDRLAHDARPGDATRTHVDAVVHAVEHVIARENRSWTARTLGAADRTGDQRSDETRSPVAGV